MTAVTRQISDDNYIVGCYLIDIWCLGVKDADLKINLTYKGVETLIEGFNLQHEMARYSYQLMRSLILGSIAYAAKIGINPLHDWDRAKFLIEPHLPFKNSVTFGREGKPFYVSGPYDQKSKRIL